MGAAGDVRGTREDDGGRRPGSVAAGAVYGRLHYGLTLSRVLVTGGGGFAGLHLLRELTRNRREGVAATTLEARPEAGSEAAKLTDVEWFSMDVASTDSVVEVVRQVRPEIVYHLAGQASVGASFGSPLPTWEVNATGTLRLLTVLADESSRTQRVLLASSAEVYGVVPDGSQPIQEETPYRPATPYGASKAAAEVAALQASRASGIEVVIARAFNHIGPGQDERFVLPSMARQLVDILSRQSRPVLRVGNLDVERDFLDVRDVVLGYIALMTAGQVGEAYNVCSGRSHSLEDVVVRLVSLSGTGAEIEVDPDRVRPADIPRLTGDPGRLRDLGWEQRIELDETLRDLLDEVGSE
ncbi:MAG: NAD-dependent epimerase/dehydratase family protein [Gemmatimonas sp.]|nr:NAD-dependent epimerase/dehydratase family protein [Gemmatimonas sp.]